MRANFVVQIITMTIILPLLIGLIRIKVIHQSYFPFLLFLFLGFLADFSAFFIYNIFYINLIQDSFSLISVCVLMTLYFQWGLFKNSKTKLLLYIIVMIIVQILDVLLQSNKNIKIPWGYITNVSIITVSSIFLVNTEFSTSKGNFFRQSRVLILIPIIIGYLYFITINILMAFLFNIHTQKLFGELYYVINYINLFSYILFTLALLWAPKKEKYL